MPEVSKTTDQALTMLEHIGDHGSMSIADVARSMDISRTVAYRLLSTLEQHGFVRRSQGIYRLGPKLFALAQHVEWALRDAAHPHMAQLVDELKETVVLSVRDRGETLTVHRIASRDRLVQVLYPPGIRHELGRTVGGRAILAHLDDDELARSLPNIDATLSAQIPKIRKAGYAFAAGEEAAELAGLAVPIRSIDGIVGSLTVYSPTERADEVRARHGAVIDAADKISAELQP